MCLTHENLLEGFGSTIGYLVRTGTSITLSIHPKTFNFTMVGLMVTRNRDRGG